MKYDNYRQAIEKDKSLCSIIAIEELSELIQCITKAKRGKLDKDHMAEEIADVLICLDWVQDTYGITDADIFKWLNKKRDRILERLNNGTFK